MSQTTLTSLNPDIVIVGAGNAALCAALSAAEHGASVLVVEAAPEDERGGNSRFTGGAFRFAYSGVDDLIKVSPGMADDDLSHVDFGTYTEDQFFDDMYNLTEYRTDPELCEYLVRNSLDTAIWVAGHGVKLHPGLGRQAYKVDGKFKFWGGLALHINGGGEALLEALYAKVQNTPAIHVVYDTPAVRLLTTNGAVTGLVVQSDGVETEIAAKAVVLACGGFEANAQMRAEFIGPGWDLAKVRGSRFNMGVGHRMAMAIGAAPAGHWSGCHAVAWDVNAPPFGDLSVGDQFQKHNYPFGICVNAKGQRYIDEGLNFHSHTYAKYGGEILKQPGQFVWQVFDDKTRDLLRSEYRIRRCTKVEADTLEELAEKLDGVNPKAFLETVRAFNAACQPDIEFNPNVRDGKSTVGLAIDKTNWALPLDKPPFHAYHVTAGITFTFGGLKINTDSETHTLFGKTIPGLYAAGEIAGGLFYHNYASGTGLMSGATFGRQAGRNAANFAKNL